MIGIRYMNMNGLCDSLCYDDINIFYIYLFEIIK